MPPADLIALTNLCSSWRERLPFPFARVIIRITQLLRETPRIFLHTCYAPRYYICIFLEDARKITRKNCCRSLEKCLVLLPGVSASCVYLAIGTSYPRVSIWNISLCSACSFASLPRVAISIVLPNGGLIYEAHKSGRRARRLCQRSLSPK